MPITGPGLSKVLLLSETEADQSHYMLDRLLRRSGLEREQFYFGLAEDGWSHQAKELGVKVVVPLGEYALRVAAQQSDIARWRGRVYDPAEYPWLVLPTFKPNKLLHARSIPGGPPDPEQMRNPPRYQGRWVRDLHYAVHIARTGFTRQPVRYLLDPSPETFLQWAEGFLRAFVENPTLLLSFDIETPYKAKQDKEDELEESEQQSELNTTILRISFSYKPYEAVSIPWAGPYLPAVKLLLESLAAKVVWNGVTFDIPVLKLVGMPVNGLHIDGMDLFKFWQTDLDKGLEAASADTTDVLPWKHLSDAMPAWYSAADSDVALRAVLYIIQQLKDQGAWATVLEATVKLMPDLREAGDRGNSIDLAYQAWLSAELDREQIRLEEAIQQVVPEELKQRSRYKRMPKELHRVVQENAPPLWFDPTGRRFEPVMVQGEAKFCSACGLRGVKKGEHTGKKSLGKTLASEKHHPKKCLRSQELFEAVWGPDAECGCPKGWPKKTWDVIPNPCHRAAIEVRPAVVEEWDEVLPFNANSSDQLKAYMKFYGHPVGTSHKTESGESADAKHLLFLSKKFGEGSARRIAHPMYGLALEKHKVDKAKSTYLWKADTNNKIHQTYTNSPSTLRLGGRAHNLMNVGKRYDPSDPESGNKWAWMARNQIVASPGNVLVQVDSSSVEAVMQGWFMGDLHYMWLANQSIHAWLATKKLGWEFNPDTVKKVKKDHKSLYDGMKVMNYTINFGGSAYGAHKANPKLFPTVKDAERMEHNLFTLLPSLEAYQYGVRFRAHKQGYLESPWKIRHHFYDVYTYKRDRFGNIEYTERGRPKLKLGKDGKRAVAFEPQHSNAMFLRENARAIFDSKWRDYVPANFLVHDGYTLDVPKPMAEEAVEFLMTLLTRPIPQMGGLRVGAEAEIGTNWGSYDPVHNPNGMKGVQKIVMEKQELSWMPSAELGVAA